MSCSSEFSGQKQTGLPEKSSFTQTCSLLSQYLKAKGSFGDLSLGMTCNVEANGVPETLRQTTATTMNLFPQKPVDVTGRNIAVPPRNLKSMDLFPQQAGFLSPVSKDDGLKMVDSRVAVAEPQTAPMTIFYGGQVIVFNDFPADKAKEIMLLASQGSSQSNNSFPGSLAKTSGSFSTSSMAKSPVESSSVIPSTSDVVPSFGSRKQECIQPPPRTISCDIPMARRASLHRFLEKRNNRITSRAPYQTTASPSKPVEGNYWLGLAAQPEM